MSFRVIYEKAIDQVRGSSLTIPPVPAWCWTLCGLADDPRPAESFPYGSPDLRRLRVGRVYEINGDVVSIWHIDRGKTSG